MDNDINCETRRLKSIHKQTIKQCHTDKLKKPRAIVRDYPH